MKSLILAATLALVPLSTPAWASGAGERGAHFEGKPSATLAQAVANFNEYNLKLKAILDGKVTDSDMAEVHQLTYTLENALKAGPFEPRRAIRVLLQLAEGLAERIKAARKLQRLDREALRLGLKGRQKHEFICAGLGWVPDTSARRISRLRTEFKTGRSSAKAK